MKKITTALSVLALVSACATNPDKMIASSVSPMMYKSYDCQQISVEADRVNKKTLTLYSQLKKKATNDKIQTGIGLLLVWPALLLLEGGDGPEAIEYTRLKGEYEALQKLSVQKKCNIEFQDLKEQLKKQKAAVQKETGQYPNQTY